MWSCTWLWLSVCVVLLDTCLTHSLFTCEPVQVQWCHNMPYNMTFFPNILEHYDQDIAASKMKHFMPLVNLHCSPDVHLFLCQAFVPECTQQTQVRRPCREHCLRVLSDCTRDMYTFDITWPLELSCDRLKPCHTSADESTDVPQKDITTPKASSSASRDLGFWCPLQLKTRPGQGSSFLAGMVWWVILTITWFLAARPKWSCEAIEKKAVWFHAVAWGLPGSLTVILLALNKVEGDGISGVCFIGLYDLTALRWFVLAPQALGVLAGLSLLLAGIVSLNHVRQVIQHDEYNQEKLKKFMIRIGVFSGLYLLPLLTLLACYLYEQALRSSWENTWINEHCQEYSIPCPYRKVDAARPDLSLFLIKYLMKLVVGISAVFWVSSKKTWSEWAYFFNRTRKKDPISESRRVLQESCEFFLKHNSRVQHKKKHYKSSSHKLKVISKSMGTNTSAQTTNTTNHDLAFTTSNYFKGTPGSGSEMRGSSKSSVQEHAASGKVSSQSSKEQKSSKTGSSIRVSGNGEHLQSP
ncbi:frizzled-6 isoform X2 [Ictalurus furcatus]|uniref:frizzled-6 isoform X2 n=1 Tax=Ictalurus furcatus TaxID=66913 RepID=UPI0023504307|nr:frizzled-6 isoform X2 [Ictalurus furcatus]